MEQERKISTPKFLGSVNTPPNQFYRLKQAVETDYEYRTLFDSTEDAAAYVVLCFGLIHDVYLRDTNTHVELTYVRLWEDENDLFNQESPLGAFRNYWNENMQLVDRNLAQFFSGRRNLPYGGSAYISAINEDWGYSVVGYLMGFAGDINRPDVLNYDVHVAAHEIGHNCGTYHTHDYGIDDCAGECGGDDISCLAINELIIPEENSIHNIYPNPFNPITRISYQLPKNSDIQITVYDLNGIEVTTLLNTFQIAGYHTLTWNASSYPSGIYLIRMDSGKFTQTKKVLLVK